jgi:hypothetical protein
MGAFIMQRDEPEDAPLVWKDRIANYYRNRVKSAEAKLVNLKKMNKAKRAKYICEQKRQLRDYYLCALGTERVDRLRYIKMLVQVYAWQPPTNDHKRFKEFMIEQLTESIKFDCDKDYLMKKINEIDSSSDADWWTEHLETVSKELSYAQRSLSGEKSRVKDRNVWKKALAESLKIAA